MRGARSNQNLSQAKQACSNPQLGKTFNARLVLSLLNVSSRLGQTDKPWFAIANSENGHRERGR